MIRRIIERPATQERGLEEKRTALRERLAREDAENRASQGSKGKAAMVTSPRSQVSSWALAPTERSTRMSPTAEAQPPPVHSNPGVPQTTEPKEGATMAQSTPQECARINDLNDTEQFVLMRHAYGYDFREIDADLRKKGQRTGSPNASQILSAVCNVLQVTEGSERDRHRIAGKIFLDWKDAEREQAGAVTLDASVELSDSEVTVPPYPSPPVNDASDADVNPVPPEKDTIMNHDDDNLRNAKALAAEYAKARSAGAELPHVSDVYSAVCTMIAAEMKRVEIGKQFGCEESSAATWVSVIVSFSNLSQAAWKTIGARPIAINALKAVAALSASADQVAALKERFEKKNSGGESGKGRRGVSNSGSDDDASKQRSESPAQSLSVVASSAEVAAPEPASVHALPNGHTLTGLLPVRISLRDLGAFTDVDLVPITFGPEASQERAQQIARMRAMGFEPVEVVMHPALDAARMVCIKTK